MKPHKWAKEIKAWADGAEIEHRWFREYASDWSEWSDFEGDWVSFDGIEYRIKPQPKENESAHIPYWLCCGSLDPHHHKTFCSEAKAGYPERCRFGTIAQHQKRMEKPQPKEPQYLYVYATMSGFEITNEKTGIVGYVGKIKLETEND